MKLIKETVEQVKYLTEANENGKKNYFIEGIFLVGDMPNRNNRLYDMRTLLLVWGVCVRGLYIG